MTETRKSKRLQLLERGITKEVRMNESVNYLDYANSPLMWAAAALAVAVVVFQSILFMKRSIKAASESALTTDQVHKAIKSSVISSIGPSVVILVTMISLLVTMGAPVAWMRLSFIGSVNYEAMAAGFGAQAMGKTLQTMDTMAFACGVWTMVCGSLGWLIFTFLFCDKMDKVNHLMSKGNAKMVPIISAGAMLGAFANLASGNFFTAEGSLTFTNAPAIATIAGCVIMMVLVKLSRARDIAWLIAGTLMQISVSGAFYIVEPISYFPILGIPGTYLTFLSGNTSNMRVPCSSVAQEAAGVEMGTEEGSIISTIGIATSILVNVVILTVGAVAGSVILNILPAPVKEALNFLLPALFGAVFGQFAATRPKLGVVAAIIAIGMNWLMKLGFLSFIPGNPSYVVILVAVFGSIYAGKLLYKKELQVD